MIITNVMTMDIFPQIFKNKNNLAIVTADGGGDGCNGTIWIKK